MGGARTLHELRQLPDEDLIREHDAETAHVAVGVNYYLQELARRDSARREQRMLILTLTIAVLTLANVAVVVLLAVTD